MNVQAAIEATQVLLNTPFGRTQLPAVEVYRQERDGRHVFETCGLVFVVSGTEVSLTTDKGDRTPHDYKATLEWAKVLRRAGIFTETKQVIPFAQRYKEAVVEKCRELGKTPPAINVKVLSMVK